MARLPRSFYERDTVTVARALLGQRLVRVLDGGRLTGLITETEAYGGADDQASHAFRRTPRSAIMFGLAGIAYVYFIYGMHCCLNTVTAADGQPGAVLIRGILPEDGIEHMRVRRPAASAQHLTDGPGKLCRALGITLAQNGLDLTTGADLFLEEAEGVSEDGVLTTPRIGVRGDAETRTRLWRFAWQPK